MPIDGQEPELTEEQVESLIAEAEQENAANPNPRVEAIIKQVRGELAKARIRNRESDQSLKDWQTKYQQLKDEAEQSSTKVAELSQTAEQVQASMKRVLDDLTEANSAVIATLPDEAKALVPGGLEPTELRKWLDTAVPVLTKRRTVPPLSAMEGAPDRGNSAPALSENELIIAQRLGVSPEDYAKYKDKK